MTLTETIATALRREIAAAPHQTLVIQQSHLARRFGCRPSHIAYVLRRRFRVADGYVVWGRRGGGGYIRIRRLVPESQRAVLLSVQAQRSLTVETATYLIAQAEAGALLDAREARLVRALCAAIPDGPAADQHRGWLVATALHAGATAEALEDV